MTFRISRSPRGHTLHNRYDPLNLFDLVPLGSRELDLQLVPPDRLLQDGVCRCLYGGAKLHPVRHRSLESVGYVVSTDGYHFTRHVDNPVTSSA